MTNQTTQPSTKTADDMLAELIRSGVAAEVSRDEAARMGAFSEDAIDLDDAIAAAADEARQEAHHD